MMRRREPLYRILLPMKGDRAINLEELARSRREQQRITLGLFRKARERGGYVILHVPLPFKLPFEDGFLYGWDEEEPYFLELIHYPEQAPEHSYRVKVGEPIFHSQPSPEWRVAVPTNLYTVARFSMAVPREKIDTGDEGAGQAGEINADKDSSEADDSWRDPQLEDLLDEGLRTLNFLIRAYRTVKDDLSVVPVGGTASLPFALLYTLWDISQSRDLAFGAACQRRDDLDLLGIGLFMVNMNLRMDPEPLSFEDTARVVGTASAALKGSPHPLFLSADLFRSAGAKLDVGDNNAAVIESVTAVETFVSTLLRLHLERRGTGKQQVDSALRADFRSKLRDHLARKMMEFDFNTRAASNPVEAWYTGAYEIRNDVVHRGLFADIGQAREAFAQSQEVLTFLTEKIKGDPDRYSHIRDLFS